MFGAGLKLGSQLVQEIDNGATAAGVCVVIPSEAPRVGQT